jgi:hypothetical protein
VKDLPGGTSGPTIGAIAVRTHVMGRAQRDDGVVSAEVGDGHHGLHGVDLASGTCDCQHNRSIFFSGAGFPAMLAG